MMKLLQMMFIPVSSRSGKELQQLRILFNTYFEDELTDQIINDLMNIKGYTKKQATNLLYSGGLKVYTTQDSKIQNILDEEYADPSNYPDTVQYELDYALTVTDPDGNQVNYSKEMLQLYFQNEDPDFDLLFDSPEDGQTYVDKYKASILANGSKVLAERVNFAPQPQSSMSVIDQHTGYVKALIGGRGEKTASLTLNRATALPDSLVLPLRSCPLMHLL